METETPPPEPQVVAPTDRPLQNVQAEFARKFGSLEQKLSAVVGYIANQEAAKAQPPPSKSDPNTLSNDDLWELAKSGDKHAFDLHQKRMAAQTYREMRNVEGHENLVNGQMQILAAKYPMLANPQHPLTQTANQAYALLTRRGYPQGAATMLEATKTAISDRPDLIAEAFTQGAQAREQARRVSAGNSGVTGGTIRQEEPQSGSRMRVSPAESAIAKRMGIADPGKAKERFLQRQVDGRSSFGTIAGAIRDEEF